MFSFECCRRIWKKHVSAVGGTCIHKQTGYLEIYHDIQQSYKKSLVIEYAASKRKKRKLKHINKWFRLFIDPYDMKIIP